MEKKSDNPFGAFGDHMDVCERCMRHPFDLCPVGARLLVEEGTRAGAEIRARFGRDSDPAKTRR